MKNTVSTYVMTDARKRLAIVLVRGKRNQVATPLTHETYEPLVYMIGTS